MDNFTVGDRCLVHRLESEAGQLLNGQHVTLVKAIIQNGRFECKFDDGTFKQIKPCNLQIINGDRVNQTKEKCEENVSSNQNKKEDQIKKDGEMDDDDKKETAAPTTTTHRQQEEEQDECPICLDELSIDCSKFNRFTCCGKGIHHHCQKQLRNTKSENIREYCPLCRTKCPTTNEEAIKQLQKWVKKKKAWAQGHLGNCYRHGTLGVKKDAKRAIVLYELAAEQGDTNAQFELGVMYNTGEGVDKNEIRASEFYKLAADQGHHDAQFSLGIMYEHGRGVDKDEKRAVEVYTLAADQGHISAQYNLGLMYAQGRGVEPDEKRAVEFFSLASEQGCVRAQYSLGVMYAGGRGVHQSYTKARELWTKAATQGHERSINAIKKVNKDLKRTKHALNLCTLAAEQGDVGAHHDLGCMYANGQVVDQSYTKARELWTKAASHGHERSINALKQLDQIEGRTTTTSSTVNSNTTFCFYCKKPEPTNKKFNKCQRCRSVSYCNRECQIKHWKARPNGHKKQCKKLAAAFKNKKNAK
jgi:TPR repeat protein